MRLEDGQIEYILDFDKPGNEVCLAIIQETKKYVKRLQEEKKVQPKQKKEKKEHIKNTQDIRVPLL